MIPTGMVENNAHHHGFLTRSSSWWLGIGDLIAEPEGPTFISSTVARRRFDRRYSCRPTLILGMRSLGASHRWLGCG